MVAASKLGADSLMLNTSMSAPELAAVLQREQPKVLVHDSEFTDVVSEADTGSVVRVIAAPNGHTTQGLPTLAQLRAGDTSPLDAAVRGRPDRDPHVRHDRRTKGSAGAAGRKPRAARVVPQPRADRRGLGVPGARHRCSTRTALARR